LALFRKTAGNLDRLEQSSVLCDLYSGNNRFMSQGVYCPWLSGAWCQL